MVIESKATSAAPAGISSHALGIPAIVVCLAALKLLIHLYFNAFCYYGYLRDELYFIDCGKHLDWGYVDIGPLTIWLGRLSRALMGDSVFALRFFPAIAGAMTIVDVGLMARELGGGRFAQGLAALAALVAPVWLGAKITSACRRQNLFGGGPALISSSASSRPATRGSGLGLVYFPALEFSTSRRCCSWSLPSLSAFCSRRSVSFFLTAGHFWAGSLRC